MAVLNVFLGSSSDYHYGSSDAVTYTERTGTLSTALGVHQRLVFGDSFNLVAYSSQSNQGGKFSADGGDTWTNFDFPVFGASTNTIMVDGIYAAGKFVIVGYSPVNNSVRFFTSEDGLTWSGNTGSLNTPSSITYGDGRFVVVARGDGTGGPTARTTYSTDGLSWSLGTYMSRPANVFFNELYYTGSRFVAVGADQRATSAAGTICSYSTTGIGSWSYATMDSAEIIAYKVYQSGDELLGIGDRYVRYSGGLSLGPAETFVKSTNGGLNWIEIDLPTAGFWATVELGSRIVIASSNDVFYTENFGLTWEPATRDTAKAVSSAVLFPVPATIPPPPIVGGVGGGGWAVGTTFLEHSRHGLFDKYSSI